MDIKKEFYGDRMIQIHFAGGLVRCDFETVQPETASFNRDGTENKFRLVMNLQGFLRTFDTMKKLTDRMLDAGILKRNLVEKLDD